MAIVDRYTGFACKLSLSGPTRQILYHAPSAGEPADALEHWYDEQPLSAAALGITDAWHDRLRKAGQVNAWRIACVRQSPGKPDMVCIWRRSPEFVPEGTGPDYMMAALCLPVPPEPRARQLVAKGRGSGGFRWWVFRHPSMPGKPTRFEAVVEDGDETAGTYARTVGFFNTAEEAENEALDYLEWGPINFRPQIKQTKN